MVNFLKKHRLKILFLSVIIGGVWYLASQKPFAQADSKEKTYTVTKTDETRTLTLTGTLEANERTAVRFASSGRLSWLGVKEGDTVRKGQALASLDQRDLKNRLQKYLNTYMKTRYDFEQARDDYDDTYSIGLTREIRDEAKRLIEKAQYDLNNSVLDVELQALSIEYASLTTPIGGIVTRIDKPYVGENITAATAEIEIVNPDTLYFSVTADQTEVIELNRGMKVTLVLDPFPEEEFTGTVNDIGYTPKSGETNTVYEVKIDLNETPHRDKLRIGMTGDAGFTTGGKAGVLSVPISFVKSEGDKKYVTVKTGNSKTKKYVTLGEEYDTTYEIVAGLEEGDILYD